MSDSTATYKDSAGKVQQDRRVHHEVRAVFDEAWALMEPMLTGGEGQSEPSGFALAVKLRSHFPQLSQSDLNLLIATATRIQRERRIVAAGGKVRR